MGSSTKASGANRRAKGTGIRSGTVAPVPVVEVAAGLVFREQRLLITQRHHSDHLGGYWEFPGGKREVNESFKQCLLRELKEELGIDVAVENLIESVRHDYAERRVRIRFYRCLWLKHEPQALGCQGFEWVSPDELSRYSFPAADARLLTRLSRSQELWSGGIEAGG